MLLKNGSEINADVAISMYREFSLTYSLTAVILLMYLWGNGICFLAVSCKILSLKIYKPNLAFLCQYKT